MTTERWLIAAMLAGGLAAVYQLADVPREGAPDGRAAAWVGEHPILQRDLDRALEAVRADRRGALRPEDRERVLNRLIDEQLLVEHGVEMGLMLRDPQLRNLLATQVMASVAERAAEDAPGDAALRSFYEDEAFRFSESARVEVEHVFVSGLDENARARAEALRAEMSRLPAEAGPGSVRGDAFSLPLPPGLLLLRDVRQVLGVQMADAVAALDVGGVTPVVRSADGFHVARLRRKESRALKPFDEVRPQVLDAFRKANADRAVQAFLERRRRLRDVRIVPETDK